MKCREVAAVCPASPTYKERFIQPVLDTHLCWWPEAECDWRPGAQTWLCQFRPEYHSRALLWLITACSGYIGVKTVIVEDLLTGACFFLSLEASVHTPLSVILNKLLNYYFLPCVSPAFSMPFFFFLPLIYILIRCDSWMMSFVIVCLTTWWVEAECYLGLAHYCPFI